MAQEPGPRQELGRQKKNPQHVGSHPPHRANSVTYSSCVSLGFLDEVWSKMGECMISVVWRCLSEGGGVMEQAAVVITYWVNEVPWVGEHVGHLRTWEEGGGVIG